MSKKTGLSLKRAVGQDKDLFVFGGNAFWIFADNRLVSDVIVFSREADAMKSEEYTNRGAVENNLVALAALMESRREADHKLVLDTINIPEGEVLNKQSSPVTAEWLLQRHLTVEDLQGLQEMFFPQGDEGKVTTEG